MQLVQFLHHHAPYNGGEIAGFPQAEADELIKRHVAAEYVPAVVEVAANEIEVPESDAIDAPNRRRRRNG